MKQNKELTQERLKELLHYNPETGHFTRLKTVMSNAKCGDIAGCIAAKGYRVIKIDYKCYKEHRLAFFYMMGRFPILIDHINRIKGDNRWCNLREVTHSQNNMNRNLKVKSKSGYIGVRQRKEKFEAFIAKDRISYHLGTFDSADEAATVRIDAEKRFFKEFRNKELNQ